MTDKEALSVFTFIAELEQRKYKGKDLPEESLDYLAHANAFLKKHCGAAPLDMPLPSRYPWQDAPAWANFAATDEDGCASWFEAEPRLTMFNKWSVRLGSRRWEPSHEFSQGHGPCPTWAETCEPRPE